MAGWERGWHPVNIRGWENAQEGPGGGSMMALMKHRSLCWWQHCWGWARSQKLNHNKQNISSQYSWQIPLERGLQTHERRREYSLQIKNKNCLNTLWNFQTFIHYIMTWSGFQLIWISAVNRKTQPCFLGQRRVGTFLVLGNFRFLS